MLGGGGGGHIIRHVLKAIQAIQAIQGAFPLLQMPLRNSKEVERSCKKNSVRNKRRGGGTDNNKHGFLRMREYPNAHIQQGSRPGIRSRHEAGLGLVQFSYALSCLVCYMNSSRASYLHNAVIFG